MSAAAEMVIVRVDSGAAWLTLNRPEKRNALNAELIASLKNHLGAADADPEVRVVVLQGAGKDFCAGADLAALERIADASMVENLRDAESLEQLFLQLRRMRKPLVAVVHGRALAGGCGLATACDLVLAGESARFGYPEVGIGFVPAMVMAILRRNLGEKRAFELVCLGETFGAADAERFGLVNRVFPDADLEAEAQSFVQRLTGRSASAVQLAKRLLYQQDTMSFQSALRSGAQVNVLARMTADARAGIAGFTASDRGKG